MKTWSQIYLILVYNKVQIKSIRMVIQIFLNAPCKPMVIVYNIQKNAQKVAKKDKMNRKVEVLKKRMRSIDY